MPTRAATAPTVRGLSPETTLHAHALLGEVPERVGRVGADLLLEQHERGRLERVGQLLAVERRLGAREQQHPPALGRELARTGRAPDRRPARPTHTISGAPSTHVPWSPNVAALHLRADENGIDAGARPNRRGVGNASHSACIVALRSSSAASAPSASATAIVGARSPRACRSASRPR